jgi:hypothetical protein
VRILLVLLLPAAQLGAQRFDSAVFVEQVRTDITTQSGSAERRRLVDRTAQFSMAARGDTLVVTADSIHLTESANAELRTINVDAVIGARWKLRLTRAGAAIVDEAPVVPQVVGDVSDVGTAMADFFPPSPPDLFVGTRKTDDAARRWQRLSDSAGVQRFQFTSTRHDTTASMNGAMSVTSAQDAVEATTVVWDPVRGPLRWSRTIKTTVTSRFGGQTVRAQVDQRIVVQRQN